MLNKNIVELYVFFNFFFRRVQTESTTGSTSSSKIRTTLTIKVENTDFDIQACVLRVKGRNIEENQYVKVCRCYKRAVLSTLQVFWILSSYKYGLLSFSSCHGSIICLMHATTHPCAITRTKYLSSMI